MKPGRVRGDVGGSGEVGTRDILALALPALGALMAEPVYMLVDTAVVARLGRVPLAALGVAGVALSGLAWVFNAVGLAGTARVARLVGAGRPLEAVDVAVGTLAVAGCTGVTVAVGCWAGAPFAARVLGASAAVTPGVVTYLRISAVGVPALFVSLAVIGVLRGWQDTRTQLVVALVANAANVILELYFVWGLGWGLAGSAWGTVMVQWGALVALAVALVKRLGAEGVGRSGRAWVPSGASMRQAGLVGGALAIRNVAIVAAFEVAVGVAARLGDVEAAGHQVVFQVWLLLTLVLDALAVAAMALTGRLLGEGDPGAARAVAGRVWSWSVRAGFVLGLLVLATAVPVAHLFTPDRSVVASVVPALLVVGLHQPMAAAVFAWDGILLGAGDNGWLAGMMVVSLGLFLPAAYAVLAFGSPLWGLWVALTWFLACRAFGGWFRYRTGVWALHRSVG